MLHGGPNIDPWSVNPWSLGKSSEGGLGIAWGTSIAAGDFTTNACTP